MLTGALRFATEAMLKGKMQLQAAAYALGSLAAGGVGAYGGIMLGRSLA